MKVSSVNAFSPNFHIMKTTTLSICLTFGLIAMFSQSKAQTNCEYPIRIGYDFSLDLPAGFSGKQDFKVYMNKVATVSAKSCEGPFSVVITEADGTVKPAIIFNRGEAVSDTSYIEAPEPPYDLHMLVETVYRAVEVKK